MRLVIQRVQKACVSVEGKPHESIGPGAVVLVGVAKGDTEGDVRYLARKTSLLRIFDDGEGKLNRAIRDAGGAFLVVSQFTLYGDCSGGNRPSYIEAADPADAERLYEAFVAELHALGHEVKAGVFRASMVVELANDGPVTILMESRGRQTG